MPDLDHAELRRESTRIALGLGSNLGDSQAHLHQAVGLLCQARIGNKPAIASVSLSSIITTPPHRCEAGAQPFSYAVLIADTRLRPIALLDLCQTIEEQMGRPGNRSRNQGEPYANRIIDIDILLYGNTVTNEERLIIPHPELHCRQFVLEPLCELAPGWMVPLLNQTTKALLHKLTPG